MIFYSSWFSLREAELVPCLIVIPELSYQDGVILNFVDDTVFAIDPSGPISGQGVSQGFRLSDPFVRVPLNIANQVIDSFQSLLVGLLPVEIIRPGVLGEDELHSARSRC